MHLVELKCQRFRCLQDLCFSPTPGMNIIRGKNAQGKTSLLEAVLFLTTSKSHRTNLDAELVRHGEDGFHLSAQIRKHDRLATFEAGYWQGAKRFKINGIAQTRLSDVLGKANVVLFSPENIDLIKGSATHRRLFVDMELSQISTTYLGALQQYRQVLRQRNELLRTPRVDSNLLDVWDDQVVAHGQLLMRERAVFVEELGTEAARCYGAIADGELLEMRYQPNVPHPEELAAALHKSRDGDARRQMTTRGPHRDDVEFLIGGKPARTYASQGQQRTAALAVKLGEAALLHTRTGEHPILMLDEALGELDDYRAQRLFESIDAGMQCLVTTADLARRGMAMGPSATVYEVDDGAVRRQ